MVSTTELWDLLGKTDPAHTKAFKRAGGFAGTAIKPIWSFRRMTEVYGPCGKGWGVGEPTFQVVHAGEEILVYCTVSIWHGARDQIVFGVGGDKAVGKFSTGLKSDDEAFKKAFTDAVTNALKLIGVGADVHMGRFDDSKYIAELKAEFAEPEKRQNPHVTRSEDVYDTTDTPDIPHSDEPKMRVKDARPEYAALVKEMQRYQDLTELKEWATEKKKDINSLPGQWPEMFRGEYIKHQRSLTPNNMMAG
jgi:hypothetical protein